MPALLHDAGWKRSGVTLLWDSRCREELGGPVLSLRELLAMRRSWPEELPCGGNAVVAAGLEACLDALAPGDAESWLESTMRRFLLDFQDEYEGGAALVLWLPSGRGRLQMKPSDDSYWWKSATHGREAIPIGRLLFAGASHDLARVMDPAQTKLAWDGDAWLGLHIARIS